MMLSVIKCNTRMIDFILTISEDAAQPLDLVYFSSQIWNKQSKVQNVNLTVVDKHGKVYKDGECFVCS